MELGERVRKQVEHIYRLGMCHGEENPEGIEDSKSISDAVQAIVKIVEQENRAYCMGDCGELTRCKKALQEISKCGCFDGKIANDIARRALEGED